MKSLRIYGRSPFGIAVIHGGPGAPGEMAPVARELAADWGVLEPQRLGALLTKADAYNPMPYVSEIIAYQDDVFQCVWQKAAKCRRTGKLLELAKQIICPVVAIHGAYDSHPAEGVQKPLSAMVDNFHFILLQHCGHMPWIERQAREEFYNILKAELRKEV